MAAEQSQLDRLAIFAAIGIVSVTQELVRAAQASMPGLDTAVAAEETLCLAVQVTLCAVDAALAPPARRTSEVLQSVPLLYHDYLLGAAALATGDRGLLRQSSAFKSRLERRQAFYAAHLPAGGLPGRETLREKMELWMGRISPPGLPEPPSESLEAMDGVATLDAHARLVQAFGRQLALPCASNLT